MNADTLPISVGLPVFNGARFVAEALDSLLAQTATDFELIISDNASTDGTEDICRAYAARDRRIRYVRNPANLGVYRNFNRVFELSTGKYFKWASADDMAHPELLERCREMLDHEPGVVLVYPKTRFIDESGGRLEMTDPGWDLQSPDPRDRFRYVIRSGHWCNLFYGLTRRDALAHTRLFPVYNSGDYRLAGELSLIGRFRETKDYLFSRRVHLGASSQNRDREWQAEFNRGRKGHPGLPFWQLCLDHAATVRRSRLDLPSKLALHGAIARRAYGAKRQLAEELRAESLWLTRAAFRGMARHRLAAHRSCEVPEHR